MKIFRRSLFTRKRIEIAIAVILVASYLVVPFAWLPHICVPHEPPKPIAHHLVIKGQNSQHRRKNQHERAVKQPSAALQPKIKTNTRTNPIDETPEYPNSWGLKFWCEVNASDFAVGLFTLFLFIATYFLWQETERLATGAEQQNAITNRAFVFYRSHQIIEVKDASGNVVRRDVVIQWLNSGNTPARRLLTHVNWESMAAPMDANFSYQDKGAPDTTYKMLGPGSDMISDQLEIPDVVWREVSQNAIHCYVWGWAEYDDAFDGSQRHRTEFCVKIWIVVHPNGHTAAIGLRFDGPHNGADGNCHKPVHT